MKHDPLTEDLDRAKEWHPEESLSFVLACCFCASMAVICSAYLVFRLMGV